jgi:heme/copper-type cytochrome/quinol oxidase subunit 2
MPIVVDVRTPDDFKKWALEQKATVKQAAGGKPPASDPRIAAPPRTAQVLSN